MILVKAMVVIFSILISGLLTIQTASGLQMRRHRGEYAFDSGAMLRTHKYCARQLRWALLGLIAVILLTEIVRGRGHIFDRWSPLLVVHLAVGIVPFAFSFILAQKFNGEKKRDRPRHRVFAYGSDIFGLIGIGTGLALLKFW